MKGDIKKLKSSDGYLYPVTVGSAVYLNKNTTVAKKMRELEELIKNNGGLDWLTDVDLSMTESGEVLTNIKGVWQSRTIGGSMNIELEIWGIKKGLPAKPYSEEDYKVAFNNIAGINKALLHAQEKGYSAATLPKGEYSICYPVPISIPSNLTFDLGGSRIKVMYDSLNRSPYDNSTSNPFNFVGYSFVMSGVTNAHLKNGEIIGDAYERSFTDRAEAAVEGSYGVSFSAGAAYCSVSYCDIHGYMGDNINFTSGGRSRDGITTGGVVGDIDRTTGELIEAMENTMYSPIVPIPQKGFKTFSLGGQGYARTTALNNKKFDVYFYRNDDTFIGVLTGRKVQTPIPIPIDASKFRLKFYDETDPNKNFQIFINFGSDCHHNVVEFNDIYNGHRGGITMGGSYNVIQYNTIRDNGKFAEVFLDGVPTFPDTTRYAINQEDSFGDNSIIRCNHISGGFHGLLLRSYSVMVEYNVFNNIGTSVLLYSVEYANIIGNYCQSGTVRLLGGSLPGKVQIIGNFLSGLDLDNPDYDCICTDNHIRGSVYTGDAIFERNSIIVKKGATLGGARLQNNRFMLEKGENERVELTILGFSSNGSMVLESNEFTNIQLTCSVRKGLLQIKDCTFTNCSIVTTASPVDLTIDIQGGRYIDTLIQPRSGPQINALRFSVTESSFSISKNSGQNNFFEVWAANAINTFKVSIVGCSFKTDNPAIDRIVLLHYLYQNTITLEFKYNTLEYTGAGVWYTSIVHLARIAFGIIAENKLKNTFITTDYAPYSSKITLYDPDKKGLTEPASGFFNTGDVWYNAFPAAGQYMGWIALNEGHANNNPWEASTAYLVGDIVSSANKVYRCSVAGTSGSTPPTHDYTVGSATDGTVTWDYLGNLAKFKPFGLIAE